MGQWVSVWVCGSGCRCGVLARGCVGVGVLKKKMFPVCFFLITCFFILVFPSLSKVQKIKKF